jgi:hypothetical protein
MLEDHGRKSLRTRLARLALYAGILVALFAVLNTFPEIRGARRAGGVLEYLGVERWQEHPRFVFWGFSLPLAGALALMSAALRHTRMPSALAVALPLGALALIVVVGLVATFPTLVPGFFGAGGAINAVCILLTIYLCTASIQREKPWPGLLRSVGYLSMAAAVWFTCGLFSTPGAVALPELGRDPAVVTDLAHKIMILWVFGWVSTALGFALERKV